MTDTRDGGPAFPHTRVVRSPAGGGRLVAQVSGMSLRDYFAGQALAGLVAPQHDPDWKGAINYGRLAYLIADAMLAQRTKENG